MLGENEKAKQFELIASSTLERLIPDDHILKRVDRVVDLSWIRDEVRHLYSEGIGRPSIDPESALRLMLAGFFQGIVHDRKLMREAQVNLAIRWFAGYEVWEELPDHSTLSRIRKRWGADLFGEVFRRTVRQCTDAGLVDAETVHADATLIRANASWERIAEKYVEDVVRENDDSGDDAGKPNSGKKGKERITDPDATLARSSPHDKPQPRYKEHMVVDDKSGVVLDVEVTTGRTPEASRLAGQMRRVEENAGQRPRAVTADRGYATGRNYAELEAMGIEAVIPARRVPKQGGSLTVDEFHYDANKDIVICPAGKIMRRGSKYKDNGWYYRGNASVCRKCKLRQRCVSSTALTRKVLIVDGHDALIRARGVDLRRDPEKLNMLKRHKWLAEGRHAEAKTQHGLARAVRRGLEQVAIQAFLTMAVINLKRLATASIEGFMLLRGFQIIISRFRFMCRDKHPFFCIPSLRQ